MKEQNIELDYDYIKPDVPERRLLYAMVRQAAQDAFGRSPSSRSAQADALQWFESASEIPFSFLWVCIHLDIEPQRLKIAFWEVATGRRALRINTYKKG